MGELDRDALSDEVKVNLGRPTDDTTIDTRINRQLQLAQIRIARAHPWTDLYTSDNEAITATGVPGDSIYTNFPTNLKDIYSLRVKSTNETEARKITWVPQRQWDQLVGESSLISAGEVTHYTRWGTTIEWFRIPSTNFTLYRRYTKWPTDFASGSAVSELDNKDDIIIAFTTSVLFQSIGHGEDAARWFVIANSLLTQAINEEMQKPDISRMFRGASEERGQSNIDPWRDPFVRGGFID